MARGNAPHTKVVHKGKQDSFVVFAVGGEEVKSWRQDKSIPLVDVVAGFKVFHTHGHGAQSVGDEASKATLDNEFETTNVDDVIKIILEKGDIQETENPERQATRNLTMGPMLSH